MKKFEIGKTYSTRSICDHNCIISFTVKSRTACMITVDEDGEIKRLRINKATSERRDAETVYPWGALQHGTYDKRDLTA